ncbi:NAD(FAD)-utilizing dehydrogenase [Aliiroseovarius zhejiangensis]|uniref:NAD(FAD)-utilizing dehydrogenase n=1 Tax=Aliiroseovarius zhejiangensis TaxID=1632025 RepID=A0ABQ3JBW2_9RHOB|nr:TIGR03862 family flavoprotein [Aliiroseovarius zhejiangensis]GHF06939.1 NAD(FAD)-utilizing dehydrogenase [Aliiroseovarius zhejiangensis]
MTQALVIGAGPAGLMAAEMLAQAGLSVTVADAKPSPARKFLMAGKSGLNLTKSEPLATFLNQIDGPDLLRDIVAGFGPEAVQDWARELGQDVFTGSSGRVFPVAMKASPLLRAWLARLDHLGVVLRRNWRWTGIKDREMAFQTPEGAEVLTPCVTVLALGGGSWSRLGSDGKWVSILAESGVACVPFQPSNMGFRVDWTAHMSRHFGSPIKPARLQAGGESVVGEFVVSSRGIEGSAVYAVSRATRDGAPLTVDLTPDRSVEDVTARLAKPRGKSSITNHLRKSLKLDPAKIALLQEFTRPLPHDPATLAALIKALPIRHQGPRPIDEAISTAGGLSFDALDAGLMIKALPGVFAAGEMLDWDAPTGGYLLTTCLATGRHAGQAAARWARDHAPEARR